MVLWFLILIGAFILVLLFAPIGFVSAVVISLIRWDKKAMKYYYKGLAGSLDQTGNVIMSPLFNIIIIKRDSPFKFGDMDEKISSVLGRNKEINKLKYLGKRIDAWLNDIDPNHSIKSIGS